jgi:hypothetical protein
VQTCAHLTPRVTLSQMMILTSLPASLLGTTASINDHPPPCRRHLFAVSFVSLLRTTIARLDALIRVASLGQARLQILNLALIPIVGICPQIDYIKLDKQARSKNLMAKDTCHARSFSLFSSQLTHRTKLRQPMHIYARTNDTKLPKPTCI